MNRAEALCFQTHVALDPASIFTVHDRRCAHRDMLLFPPHSTTRRHAHQLQASYRCSRRPCSPWYQDGPWSGRRPKWDLPRRVIPPLISLSSAARVTSLCCLSTGYCWPSELKCSGVKTRTVTGKLPGANAIGDCQSFASAHPVVDGCINSDCTGGCDAMNVKPHACIEDTRAYSEMFKKEEEECCSSRPFADLRAGAQSASSL